MNDDYIHQLETAVELLTDENTKLREENETLKKRLLLYENPHTPPSLQRFKPKPVNPQGKKGAPKGHKGAYCHKEDYRRFQIGKRITELPVYLITVCNMEP